MSNKYLTFEELVSAINHSVEPYILVEGPDDVFIYRKILDDIDCIGNLHQCGGCCSVQRLFDNRHRITNSKVIFIKDKDKLVYSKEIPPEYHGIIFTDGYSIENDLYQGKALEDNLFTKEDKNLFTKAINSFLLYYACELDKYLRKEEHNLSLLPEIILDEKHDYSLCTSKLPNYSTPSNKTVEYIKNGYDLLLRGHSLFSIVRMIMGRKNRKTKYNTNQILEICYGYKSESIKNMQNKIKQALSLL